MLEFSGQLTTPDRFSYHTGCGSWLSSYNHISTSIKLFL